jgi:hypothetical protein
MYFKSEVTKTDVKMHVSSCLLVKVTDYSEERTASATSVAMVAICQSAYRNIPEDIILRRNRCQKRRTYRDIVQPVITPTKVPDHKYLKNNFGRV